MPKYVVSCLRPREPKKFPISMRLRLAVPIASDAMHANLQKLGILVDSFAKRTSSELVYVPRRPNKSATALLVSHVLWNG